MGMIIQSQLIRKLMECIKCLFAIIFVILLGPAVLFSAWLFATR